MSNAFCVVVALAVWCAPGIASAQWSVGAYVGGARTHPAAMTVRFADGSPRLHLDAVTFRSESLRTPIYYGYRLGHAVGDRGFWIEAEFIHLKIIARRSSLAQPLESFAMTHGMNFVLANLVWTSRERAGRIRWMARAGVGPTLPHAESCVAGLDREGYEFGGVGVQLAPGAAIRLTDAFSLTTEYKFTIARPTVDVAGGVATTSVRTHHGTVGLAAVF